MNVSINNDAWIPDVENLRLSSFVYNMWDSKVVELIDSNERIWKWELIVNTFSEEDAENILRILLAKEPHDDCLLWSSESSGEYSVCSAYKLLQNSGENPRAYVLQTNYWNFYKKNFGSKISLLKSRLQSGEYNGIIFLYGLTCSTES